MSVEFIQQVALHPYTTLGVGGEAEYFVEVHQEAELIEAITYAQKNNLCISILGGGSNVLVSDGGVRGLVIKIALKGISSKIEGDSVEVTANAGESLDDVVLYCVTRGWWGIENLSHIPGTVGATPIQNVGAYGVEVKDVITFVTAINTETNAIEQLSNEFCTFGYRDSFFKKSEAKKYIITSVSFSLSTKTNPQISYRDLEKHFGENVPTLLEIREAVIAIRAEKFPNWKEVGTAGSFFKNPSVTQEKYHTLLALHPELPGYSSQNGMVKLSLGWILDKVLHLKGYKEGRVSTYQNQALVLIVEKNTTATEVLFFAEKIIEKIKKELGVTVECEVTLMK